MEQIPGQKFTVAHDSPLLEYLYEVFPGQSKKGVKAYLSNGQVVVNGRKVSAFDEPLHGGDTFDNTPEEVFDLYRGKACGACGSEGFRSGDSLRG